MDFWTNLAITVILSSIKQAVRNPESKAALKRALYKVRDAIDALYATDEQTPEPAAEG